LVLVLVLRSATGNGALVLIGMLVLSAGAC
jgi:hypothetical protein